MRANKEGVVKTYNPGQPLIFIHVPKTAGTTVRRVFYDWFGKNLYYHYYNPETGTLPERVDVKDPVSGDWRPGICIYGHFNCDRRMGVADYYPDVSQFVTILRDPFELMVSAYFYVNSQPASWSGREWILHASLEEFLERSPASVFAPFLPIEMDKTNFREVLEARFVHLGITEDLQRSLDVMAHRLSFPLPDRIDMLNRTERPEHIEYDRLRQRFVSMHQFDYRIYEFARELNGGAPRDR